ncbi:hypothetical protein DFH09DRAFT_1276839 [Mycena vulgaris]|nr:hypothetical protein DFH09DRAFT_1276839 [Mycena vulgaris]
MDPPKSKSMHRAQKKGLSSVGVRSSYVPIPWNLGVFERYCAALLSYCDSDSDFRRVLFFSGGCNLSVAPAPWVRLQYFKVLVRSCFSSANWPRRAIGGSYLVSSTLFVASPTYVFTGFTCSTLEVNTQFQKSYSSLRLQTLYMSFCPPPSNLVFDPCPASRHMSRASISVLISGCVDSSTRSQNLNNERPYITGGHRNSLLDSNPLGHTLQANSSGVVYGTPRGFMSGKIDFTRKPGFDSPRPTYFGALHSFFEHPLLVSNSLGLDIRFS